MLAILGFILAGLAGLFRLLSSHQSWVIPLLIIAVLLVCAEVAWGWHRTGRYGPRG